MKPGDTYTIEGVYHKRPNPARKWWSIWRPKMITTNRLKVFTVEEER